MRERGLKLPCKTAPYQPGQVAPHAGAWIETFLEAGGGIEPPVAPHAGAWIETGNRFDGS